MDGSVFPALVLPIISTYVFLVAFLPSRYFILRMSKPHFGMFLSCAALISLIVSSFLYPYFQNFQSLWETSENYIVVFFCLMLSPIEILQGLIYNIFELLYGNKEGALLDQASFLFGFSVYFSMVWWVFEAAFPTRVRGHLDPWVANALCGRLIYLLMSFLRKNKSVVINMKNGKVYVGYLMNGPDLKNEKKYFTLIPLYSGYRDENHALRLTNDYKTLWDAAVQLIDSDEKNRLILTYSKIDTEVKIGKERMIEIISTANMTFSCDDIFSIGEWIPELYNIQSIDTDHIQNL